MPGRFCRCTVPAVVLVVRVWAPGAGRGGPAPSKCPRFIDSGHVPERMRPMRPRLIAFLTLLAAVAAVPATATAKPLVGISENNAPMFADPNFKALGVKTTRLVVSWNAATVASKGDDELSNRVFPYLDAAKASGVDVLIAVEHSRGAA